MIKGDNTKIIGTQLKGENLIKIYNKFYEYFVEKIKRKKKRNKKKMEMDV